MKITYTKEDRERHREYGSAGGRKAAEHMTKAERKARARKATEARWAKKKAEVAQ